MLFVVPFSCKLQAVTHRNTKYCMVPYGDALLTRARPPAPEENTLNKMGFCFTLPE